MKFLDKDKYGKLTEPLQKVSFNNLFARAVVEHKITGKVYVDDTDNPTTYYVVHPYGMTLLFGDSSNEAFNNSFRDYSLNVNHTRNQYEWMQAYPDNWHPVLNELFKDVLITSAGNKMKKETNIIELNTRVNFKFHRDKFRHPEKTNLPGDIKIVRTDRQIFRNMPGSVVPYYFWDSEDDFIKNGVGFSLFFKGTLASTVYSSCIQDDQLELGIETTEEFRGQGFAEYACAALIDYCLENNYEPVWACRLENTASYKLAQKVGFIPSLELPYYRLSK